MNRIVLLALVILSARPAIAALPDDELSRALRTIVVHVRIEDPSLMGRWNTNGQLVMHYGLIGVGLAAFPITFRHTLSTTRLKIMAFAQGAALGGVLTFIASDLWYLFREGYRPQPTSAYRGREGLYRFFRLSLGSQYRVASQDSELAAFLIDFARSYERLNEGLPEPAAVSAAAGA